MKLPQTDGLQPDLPLNDAFDQYRTFIRAERGLTTSTVESYMSWLHHFSKWLESNGHEKPSLSLFNQAVLTSFINYLHGKKLRPRSIRSVFFPLRSFGDFLVLRLGFSENYAKLVQLPKKDAAVRLTVSDQEVQLLLESATRIKNQKRSKMAVAIISVMAYSGLRRSEILGLNLQDVKFSDGSVLVRSGKGGKSRRVFPSQVCLTSIMDYISVRQSNIDALFIGGGGQRLGEQALSSVLEEVKCIAGLRGESRVCIHALRHNCATRLLRNGADIGQIKQFLGHSSIQTTEIYLHTGEEDIRGIADKTGFILSKTELPKPRHPEAQTSHRPIRSSVQQRRSRRG